MLEKKEYFCWVRVVELSAARAAEAEAVAVAATVPEPTPAPLPEPADWSVMRSVEIAWREKPERKYPPPAPRLITDSPFPVTRRHVLGMQQVTTVHLEHAAPGVFPLDIELQPVFGSKNEAIQWIESDAGVQFCEGAKAVSLLCFASVGGP